MGFSLVLIAGKGGKYPYKNDAEGWGWTRLHFSTYHLILLLQGDSLFIWLLFYIDLLVFLFLKNIANKITIPHSVATNFPLSVFELQLMRQGSWCGQLFYQSPTLSSR